MNFSATFGELAKALCRAQAEFASARKDTKNPQFHTNYADLSSLLEASRDALTKHDLCLIQGLVTNLDRRTVTAITRIIHGGSGEYFEQELEVPAVGQGRDVLTAQTIGAAATYARRYGLKAALNLAEEDDDGNSGGAHKPQSKPTTAPAPEQQPASTPQKQQSSAKPWSLKADKLRCFVEEVRELKISKGRNVGDPYLLVKVNGKVGDKDALACFHQSLFPALLNAKGKVGCFRIKVSDYPTLEDIIDLDGEIYADGHPLNLGDDTPDPLEINADDIPA